MADELIQPEELENMIEQDTKTARKREKPAKESNDPVEELIEASIEAPIGIPEEPVVSPVQFGQLTPAGRSGEQNALDLILDVQLQATVELGRSQLMIRDILALGPGSVVELDKHAGEPADLLVNGKALARGEVVVIDENFGIRITEIIAPTERVNSLR